MSECKHHWHINWMDKFSEIIQCCHCGEHMNVGGYNYRSKDVGCGNGVRSRVGFTPPIHDYITGLTRCTNCNGSGEDEGSQNQICATCGGEGRIEN